MLKSLKNSSKNVIGWTGAITIVLNYLLLTTGIFTSDGTLFNIFQFIGGSLLAIRVWLDRNYSNFVLELFFISIAIYALLK